MTEVWAVVEMEEWEAPWTRSLHATKAGAWRAAYERRYDLAVSARETKLLGYEPGRDSATRVVIERREVLP